MLLTVAVICVLSVVVGRAIWCLAGVREWSPLAPATGFAALLIVASVAIRLQDHAASARIVLGALFVLSLAVLLRARPGRIPIREVGPVALLALLLTLLPFVGNGRVGIVGVLNNADFVGHLLLADALRVGPPPEHLFYAAGYPSGPHSLAAALTVFGGEVDTSFTALLLVVPILTGLAALAALPGLSGGRRVVVAVLVALPYLGAAYLAQASYKEPTQALLVLTFALILRELHGSFASRSRLLGPAGVVVGGMVVTYSLAGLVWPAVTVLTWAAYEFIRRRSVPSLDEARRAAIPAALFVAVMAAAVVPLLDRLGFVIDRIAEVTRGATTGGNIADPINPFQVLGVWLSDDFRETPAHFEAVAAVTLVLAVFSLVWWARRREVVVVVAIAACLGIYLQARYAATPYYDAKALAVAAPLVVLLIGRALITGAPPLGAPRTWWRGGGLRRARAATAVAFIGAALVSTSLALLGTRVLPSDHADELATLRPLVQGRPTLFLGQDDYALWDLRGAQLSTVVGYIGNSQVPFTHRPDKRFRDRISVDFDSFDRGNLDRFEYMVAPRADYLGSPPANWHRLRQTDSYALWERTGTSPDREILAEGVAPGATLDCRRPEHRDLSTRTGWAGTRPLPILGRPAAWRSDTDAEPAGPRSEFTLIEAGSRVTQELELPPGDWLLSLQYVSPTPVTVRAPGDLEAKLPPVEERFGPFWPAGRVSGGGRIEFEVAFGEMPRLGRKRMATLGTLVATRADVPETTVALSQACGRYVTWYTVADA